MSRRVILVLSFFIQVAIIFEAYASDTAIKGTGATSATAGLEVTNSSDASLLYVRNDGNVGIGTTNPGAALDVNGTAKMTGFQLGTSTTANYILTADNTGVGTWQQAPSRYGDVPLSATLMLSN